MLGITSQNSQYRNKAKNQSYSEELILIEFYTQQEYCTSALSDKHSFFPRKCTHEAQPTEFQPWVVLSKAATLENKTEWWKGLLDDVPQDDEWNKPITGCVIEIETERGMFLVSVIRPSVL